MAINRKRAVQRVGGALAPRLVQYAPGVTAGVIRQSLNRAIAGVGPLPSAAASAEKQLTEQKGRVDKAVQEVIDNHVAVASVGGFATNLGGLVTAAVTIPANITELVVVQCHMVAGIAHLRGYDLEDPRVRNAVLECLLGEEKVSRQVKRKKLPAPPMALATAPTYDSRLDSIVAAEVAGEVLGRIAGKRLATTAAKKIPVVGGVVGAGADAWATYQVGRYADRELLPRARR